MEHGPLQHPLKTQRRLHIGIVVIAQQWRGLVDKILQLPSQTSELSTASPQNLSHLRRVRQSEQ